MSYDSSFAQCSTCGESDCECGELLEELLVVGAKIKIGSEYSKKRNLKAGQIITLVEGQFENDNGLYTELLNAPSLWNEDDKEFDSIYHLFGNDLDEFADCEVINS